jgi:hypothetical protein
MSVVYSNTEMNQQSFNHDDLDDLCSAPSFIKKWEKEKDFLVAFGIQTSNGKTKKDKFPYISKLLNEPTSQIVKFWSRSTQQSLSDADRMEREEWVKVAN